MDCAALTRRWIERFVIAENLCPFAAQALETLRVAVSEEADDARLAMAVLDELDLLQRTPEAEISTSVLVFPNALADFDRYLDFAALADELVEACGLAGIVQIATFHPQYRFDAAAADDVGNYTNRAPFPALHFLREAALSRALAGYPQPETIPQRNIDHLRALGLREVRQRLATIRAG